MLLEEKEGISVNIEEERAFSVNFKKKKIQAPTHIRKRACLCPVHWAFSFNQEESKKLSGRREVSPEESRHFSFSSKLPYFLPYLS